MHHHPLQAKIISRFLTQSTKAHCSQEGYLPLFLTICIIFIYSIYFDEGLSICDHFLKICNNSQPLYYIFDRNYGDIQ